MGKKKIADVVTEIAADFLKENGYELYNTEFVKEGRDWFLRVYIDRVQSEQANQPEQEEQPQPLYISTEDCEKVSRFLSGKLDESDPIEQNYYLEVSSPGMDRPLIRPEHYERYIGHEVEVRLYKARDGVKNIEGILENFDRETETVTVKAAGGSNKGGKGKNAGAGDMVYELKLADIAKANLAVVF